MTENERTALYAILADKTLAAILIAEKPLSHKSSHVTRYVLHDASSSEFPSEAAAATRHIEPIIAPHLYRCWLMK